ncbi:MAG: OprO/OprP family phosphate-selective porin [Gemmatimonadota bacterium]|nr:OprO/OprP family phosphate-selective porin [Gemmatimonadota bacterium]MDH3423326.1 OprO/OprP family phosphate-selective porin [Gemmatimonadota bacterium]
MLRRLARLLAVFALVLPLPLSAQLEVSGRGADLRIGGRVHSQYSVSSIDAATSDFFIRRARLNVDVAVNDFLSGRVQPEFSGGSASVLDAYAQLDFSPGFRIAVGQFKRSFDIFELASSTDLSLIERDGRIEGYGVCSGVGSVCSYSRLTEALDFAGRDQGVRVEGSSGQLSYQATLTNGTGLNTSDENDRKSVAGRVTLDINENVRASGQLALHDYVDPAADNATAVAFGGDVEIGTWRDGLLVQAGLIIGDNWELDPVTSGPPSFLALQGVASYYVPVDGERVVGIEPLARISYGDPDTDTNDDNGLLITPGFMVYIMGRSKIGANFDIYSPATGDKEFSFKIQSFLYF